VRPLNAELDPEQHGRERSAGRARVERAGVRRHLVHEVPVTIW